MSYLSALVKNIEVEEPTEQESIVKDNESNDTIKTTSHETEKETETKPKNKNAFRRKKQPKVTKKPIDPNYMKILTKVQDSFLLKVMPDQQKCDQIESNMTYMKNWTVSIYIDTSEDIVETFEDKEYKFQKTRILGSRYFQNMVREMYTTKFGNVNVSFNWNRNYPDSYTIRVRG